MVTAWKGAYDIKTVVIIHDLEDAVSKAEGAKVLPMLFKKEGIDVLETLTYRTEDTDFSAQITKAKSLNPDGIGVGRGCPYHTRFFASLRMTLRKFKLTEDQKWRAQHLRRCPRFA